jgi:hypothetical protein
VKFWLIVYLFDVQGQMLAKDIIEAEDKQQCETFAGEYAVAHLNTQQMMQMHCVSDEEYRGNLE